MNALKCKKEQNTYILFMQNDTNTYGYNQWFYFSVRNMKMQTKYTFRISNFVHVLQYLEKKIFFLSKWPSTSSFFPQKIKSNRKWLVQRWSWHFLLSFWIRIKKQQAFFYIRIQCLLSKWRGLCHFFPLCAI